MNAEKLTQGKLCAPVEEGVALPGIIDLTFPFGEDSIYWPTATPWKLTNVYQGTSEDGYWCSFNKFSAAEHGGTHVDAPRHFSQVGRTLDQVPLQEWIGPAVKIDVRTKCEADRDYSLQITDVLAWEEKHGRIPDQSWVIMFTGHDGKHYPDKKQVLGTDKQGEEAIPLLSFPGFSSDVITFLVKERNIKGVGIDTPSIDPGRAKDFAVHSALLGADRIAVENIANLDRLPETGATLFAIPILIKDGTGGPARVFAITQ